MASNPISIKDHHSPSITTKTTITLNPTIPQVDKSLDHIFVSSAAACITLTLLGKTFRPEFTHQLFEGEVIRGYEPTPKLMTEILGMAC